jgi:protein involved in sex pheromone biosynthesis
MKKIKLSPFVLAFTSILFISSCGNEAKKELEEQKRATADSLAVAPTPKEEIKPAHPYFNSILNYISGIGGKYVED